MSELWGGFVMACRRWPVMLALTGMIAAACVVLAFALEDVLSQVAVLKGAEHLREHHAVTFTPYYLPKKQSYVGMETVRFAMDQMNQNKAYTAIVNNMGLDDPDFAGGHPTLILFGHVVPNLYPDLSLSASVPSAMRGAHLANEHIDPVTIARTKFTITGTLPAGATFFDPEAAGLPLDDHLVIRVPTSLLPFLRPVEREEALTRMVLLNPDRHTVDQFVSGCARGGLYLVPHDLAVDQPQRFRRIMMSSAMYIVGMLSFLILVFTAFTSVAYLTIRQEHQGLKIRTMYGATPFQLGLRIGAFLATVVIVPPLILLMLLHWFFEMAGAPAPNAPLFVMFALVGAFICLWLLSMWRIRTSE